MGAWTGNRIVAGCLLAVACAANAGCLSCFNPVRGPQADCIALCHEQPRGERNHVYVFFLNGLDPVNCCNLTGVRDCVQRLGFIKTYYGQPFHYWWFASEIRRLRHDDPDARFVLVGSQWGANLVCSLARDLRGDDITIDLALLLDGCWLDCKAERQPDNVDRIVHLWSRTCLLKGKDYPGAENVCIEGANVFGCGGHPETMERLALELSVVAAGIPIETNDLPVPPEAPAPQPVEDKMPQVSKKWDFLQPRSNRPGAAVPETKPAEQVTKQPTAP
jgi:hypothetical protein